MATTQRAALYARVSTIAKGQDVDLQLRDLRDLAQRNDWQSTEFVDNGVSGRKESRPAFDEMMKQVRQRHFDIVAVWKLDRLTRSLKHAVNTLAELKELKVELVALKDGLNFSGTFGVVLYALIAALAEVELTVLRERTIAGLANARAKGKRLGRPPIGIAETDEIRRLKQGGLSQEKIAKKLGVSTAYVSRALQSYKSFIEKVAKEIENA